MRSNLPQHKFEGTTSARARQLLYSCLIPSNLLVAAIFFSIASLFPVEVQGLPILKLIASACVMLAAVVSAKMSGTPIHVYAASVVIFIVLFLSGAFSHLDALANWELWLIKPILFIPIMAMTMPLLASFDYSNSKFQKGLSIMIILLMVTFYAQGAFFLVTKELFDFQAALGLEKTRSHLRLYSLDTYIDVYRLSGIAVEPAIYCTTMFCLLLMCKADIHRAIRIPAEITIGLCLSALGWIMLAVLLYRNFMMLPLNRSLGSAGVCLCGLIVGLILIYPVEASKGTLQRIICSKSDPSANARLFAYLPQNTPMVDVGICPPPINIPSKQEVLIPSKQEVLIPSKQEVLAEATTGHQRGSNVVFIDSGFGVTGLVAFLFYIFSLTVLSRRPLSFPVFVFSLVISAATEPIFWLGFSGWALLLRRRTSKQLTATATIA